MSRSVRGCRPSQVVVELSITMSSGSKGDNEQRVEPEVQVNAKDLQETAGRICVSFISPEEGI
jgi:hypothetical protein